MLAQDLSKGFVSWKEMYFENKEALEALGGKLIFAGPQKEIGRASCRERV